MAAVFRDWIRSGATMERLRADVQNKKRQRTEPLWEMRKLLVPSNNGKPSVAQEAFDNSQEFLRRRGTL